MCAPHERQEHGFGDHEPEGCLRERAPLDEAEETAKRDLLQKLIDLPPVPRRAGTNEHDSTIWKEAATSAACVQIRWIMT